MNNARPHNGKKSDFGPKRTRRSVTTAAAFEGKADID
jgi:hypothetical protein